MADATIFRPALNAFLAQAPDLQVVATHMNTIVAPAEPNAMPSSEESTIIIFCTLFYTDYSSFNQHWDKCQIGRADLRVSQPGGAAAPPYHPLRQCCCDPP
jgi:hypothetical protein